MTTRLEGTQSTQDHMHFWHQLDVLGIPKTILGLNNSSVFLTELSESYYTCGYGLVQRKDKD